MFDQMKAMGQLAGLLKNKDRLKQIAEEFKEKVDRISVTGTAGGSAVRVTVSGKMRVTNVSIDPAAASAAGDAASRDMLQGLILDATNDALAQVQAIIAEEARRYADELGLPQMPGLERMLGG